MRKDTLLIVVGILILVTPALGIPGSWKSYLFLTYGIVVILSGILIRYREHLLAVERGRQTNAYAESGSKDRHAETGRTIEKV